MEIRIWSPRWQLCTIAIITIGAVSQWLHSQVQIQVGYAIVTASSGSLPVSSELFTYTNSSGVLISQAGVTAVEPIRTGRFFVDEAGTRTALALVNPSSQSASVTLILRDDSGMELARLGQVLAPGQHLSRYVRELFTGLDLAFVGSLTFQSDLPLGAITLRESYNRYNEPVYATLPVTELETAPNSDPILFPHIAAGEGYQTQLVLINPGNQTLQGKVHFRDSRGYPLVMQVANSKALDVTYNIKPQGTYRLELESVSGLQVGYAMVTPEAGYSSPEGVAIFQIRMQGQLVTEASVTRITPTARARIFVDQAGSETGVAVANPSDQAARLTFSLMDRFGHTEATAQQTLPAGGHLAKFVQELFPDDLTEGFTGLLEIQSSVPISPINLKLTTNSRGEMVLTTLPIADLNRTVTATSVLFPQVAAGSGFSTRLIFINPDRIYNASGSLSFFQSDGSPMATPMGGEVASRFPYQFAPGSGRQFYPGNIARISSIQMIDPSSNQPTQEITINEGNIRRPRLRIIDSTGALRDDVDVQIQSIDPEIASVDLTGSIKGEKRGFSTLVVTAGNAVITLTANIVTVNSGVQGFEATGIAQDLARRLYVAATEEHTILLTQDLKQRPELYAGIKQMPGLRNDARLQSLFRRPAFIVLNQAEGSLYVSDGSNNLIRRVRPGSNGRVETFAGTGDPGARDGRKENASFKNPQGLALDERGNVWVADSGNHTIRRITANGIVETIAGQAGSAGNSDGVADQARFNTPLGLTVETEPVAHELERQRTGDPPPPIRVIVADSGNGILRRVYENGQVETVVTTDTPQPNGTRLTFGFRMDPVQNHQSTANVLKPARFTLPTGIATDSSGNIYVTDRSKGGIKIVLRTGEIASGVQVATFNLPLGIIVGTNSHVIVSDQNRLAGEVVYGQPVITSITPNIISNKGGDAVTIRGGNFTSETFLVAGGVVIRDAEILDTKTIRFIAPILPSGKTTLTIENRGGLQQDSLFVSPTPLQSLPPGDITTVVGGTTFAGEGQTAVTASLFLPRAVHIDSMGNVLIADTYNYRVRKVDARTGRIITVAGNGQFGFSGDGGPATAAALSYVSSVVTNSAGDIYFGDSSNNRVRKLDSATHSITTVAGNGSVGHHGDNGPAVAATLNSPGRLAVDRDDNLFIADGFNYCVRKVDTRTGIITTVAGSGVRGYSGDRGLATAAQMGPPLALTFDVDGNLFIADWENHRIRKVDSRTGIITTVAGNGKAGYTGDNGPAVEASLFNPIDIAFDADGNLYLADHGNFRIRRIDKYGIITSIAGGGVSLADSGLATEINLVSPEGLDVDSVGNVYIADAWGFRIRQVDTHKGVMTTVAGNGDEAGHGGDGGPATAAALKLPNAVIADTAGNLYVSEAERDRIRKVDAQTGIITTVGTGFGFPQGLAIDSVPNLYVGSVFGNTVMKVQLRTGNRTRIAGTGEADYSGDNGPAVSARLSSPAGIAVDGALDIVYISDSGNHRIRRIDSRGIITTIAGTGSSGGRGDGGPALAAELNSPGGLTLDTLGNLYIADTGNHRIRSINLQSGIITTVVGTGEEAFSGDGGPALAATLNYPRDVHVDSKGNFYIADSQNYRVRRVDGRTRVITTVAGGCACLGDNGPATDAGLYLPIAVTTDSSGNLLIADYGNDRIRGVRIAASGRANLLKFPK